MPPQAQKAPPSKTHIYAFPACCICLLTCFCVTSVSVMRSKCVCHTFVLAASFKQWGCSQSKTHNHTLLPPHLTPFLCARVCVLQDERFPVRFMSPGTRTVLGLFMLVWTAVINTLLFASRSVCHCRITSIS